MCEVAIVQPDSHSEVSAVGMLCYVVVLQNEGKATLRTFALIVSTHPYCARNSRRQIMPRHALSARAVEEM